MFYYTFVNMQIAIFNDDIYYLLMKLGLNKYLLFENLIGNIFALHDWILIRSMRCDVEIYQI